MLQHQVSSLFLKAELKCGWPPTTSIFHLNVRHSFVKRIFPFFLSENFSLPQSPVKPWAFANDSISKNKQTSVGTSLLTPSNSTRKLLHLRIQSTRSWSCFNSIPPHFPSRPPPEKSSPLLFIVVSWNIHSLLSLRCFFSSFSRVTTASFLATIIFFAAAGNILVCVAIYTERSLRRIGNLFLASLAIADLFVSLLVMTFAGVNDILGENLESFTGCCHGLLCNIWKGNRNDKKYIKFRYCLRRCT